MAFTTSEAFSPFRINTIASTTSLLSVTILLPVESISPLDLDTKPSLGTLLISTVATSFTNTGTPLIFSIMMFFISLISFNNPMPLTTKAWSFWLITSPPIFILLFCTAVETSNAVMPRLFNFAGSTFIS